MPLGKLWPNGRGLTSEMGHFRKLALVTAMSAFPPIATKLRTSREVRFVPTPEVAASFDYVVGDCEHFIWNDKAKRPGGLAVDDEIKFGWLLDRQIAGLRPT